MSTVEDFWLSSGFGNWTTSGVPPWSTGSPPATDQDAFIAAMNSVVISTSNETVNSIGTNTVSTLLIESGSTFAATNGTTLDSGDTGSTASGNLGQITVENTSMFEVGQGTFDNAGTIELNSSGSTTAFEIENSVSLTGNGSILMSPNSNNVLMGAGGSSSLTNVNNDISGGGQIGGAAGLNFTNDGGGTVETNNSLGSGTLQIAGSADGSFVNNGLMEADNGGNLIFGEDGKTSAIVNNGAIEIENSGSNTSLEIAGNVTVSGTAGTIAMGGSSTSDDEIVSDGTTASLTLVNQTLKGAGTVGDANLTLDNQSGTIDADAESTQESAYLTLNTGNNTITNEAAGILEADGSALQVFSPVNNAGTILVEDGIAYLHAPISGSGAIDVGHDGLLFAISTIAGNVTFTGTGGQLVIDNTNANGGIGGNIELQLGNSILFIYVPYSASDHAIWNQINSAGGTLSLVNGSSTLATLNLAGQYTSGEFSLQDNGGSVQVGLLNPIPPAATTADMIMRDGYGNYEIYDIGNNAILAAYALGGTRTEWQAVGLGGFDGADTSDMLLRNSNNGAFEIFDISNNNITNTAAMGRWGWNGSSPALAIFPAIPARPTC